MPLLIDSIFNVKTGGAPRATMFSVYLMAVLGLFMLKLPFKLKSYSGARTMIMLFELCSGTTSCRPSPWEYISGGVCVLLYGSQYYLVDAMRLMFMSVGMLLI